MDKLCVPASSVTFFCHRCHKAGKSSPQTTNVRSERHRVASVEMVAYGWRIEPGLTLCYACQHYALNAPLYSDLKELNL